MDISLQGLSALLPQHKSRWLGFAYATTSKQCELSASAHRGWRVPYAQGYTHYISISAFYTPIWIDSFCSIWVRLISFKALSLTLQHYYSYFCFLVLSPFTVFSDVIGLCKRSCQYAIHHFIRKASGRSRHTKSRAQVLVEMDIVIVLSKLWIENYCESYSEPIKWWHPKSVCREVEKSKSEALMMLVSASIATLGFYEAQKSPNHLPELAKILFE